jgi:hypothetical protein
MNNKGQSVMAEHVMIFFVVMAALMAMTIFVRRGFEARIHDARNYMINSVMDNSVCDTNCIAATGNIQYEYEPYYEQTLTDIVRKHQDTKEMTNGSAQDIGAKYLNSVNEEIRAIVTSVQLPPECADGANPKPTYCGD